jgi:hypothetical protein
VQLGKANELSVGSSAYRVGEDWMPLGLSSSTRIENTTVTLVGFGITASELKYDDFSNTNVAGNIALAFSGSPDGENPHGQFVRYEDARWKAIAARNAGAKALLIIASEEKFKDDRLAKLRYNNSAGDAGLPVAVISRQVAVSWLGLKGLKELAAFEGTAQKTLLEQSKTSERKGFGYGNWTEFGPDKLKDTHLTIAIDVARQEVAAANVIGVLPGSDPTLKNEVIVIGAHYDHLGYGGEGSLAPKEGAVHHGADDNASGVAGVLELARLLTTQRPRPKRTIVFAAFSGEEEGLLGSNYYVNHPAQPLANTVAMINMDMIGRLKKENLVIGGVGTAQEWRPLIEAANSLQGLTVTTSAAPNSVGTGNSMPIVVGANGQPIVTSDSTKQFSLTLNEDGYGPSDHSSFYAKQIPVLFFWTGTHDDYHKPSDTADKINYAGEARILSLIARIVRNVDSSSKRPTYTLAKAESPGRSVGFRVYLGTIPTYGDSKDGLLLDGVRDDSPAAKAGLKGGDKVVKLAGFDVHNVNDYTYALGEMKAGQEYEVEVMRAGERLKLKIVPAARK